MTTDILFLFVSKSGGHARAAEAIEREINIKNPSVKTRKIDASYFYPVLSPIISKFYLEVITKTPEIWNYVYDNDKVREATQEIRNLFSLINQNKFKKLLETFKPKIIVCTHAMPANIISYCKMRNGHKISTVSVITDYGLHSYWAQRGTDQYFVPDESIAKKLMGYGISPSKICVSGIPVDMSFSKKYDKKFARGYFGLNPNQFTVLLMGGNEGIGPYDGIITGLSEPKRRHMQMLVSAGNNTRLYYRLCKDFGHNKNVRIHKYIKNVSCAMDSADVLITKPGGLTITEAIIKELPMVIINPIPGQELRNTDFLVRHRLAIKCSDINDVPPAVELFALNGHILKKFRQRLKNIAKINAANVCAEKIMKFL